MGDLQHWKPESGNLPKNPVEWREYEIIMGEDGKKGGSRGGGSSGGSGGGLVFFIVFFVLLFIIQLYGALH